MGFNREGWVVSPERLISIALQRGLITVSEASSKKIKDSAREEAEYLKDSWPTDQGFGSSDTTSSVVNMLNGAGINVKREGFGYKRVSNMNIKTELIKVAKNIASFLREGDVCKVDMDKAKSFGGLGFNQLQILRRILKEGGGKVVIKSISPPPSGMSTGAAYVFAFNNPVSRMIGGVSVPWHILIPVGYTDGSGD